MKIWIRNIHYRFRLFRLRRRLKEVMVAGDAAMDCLRITHVMGTPPRDMVKEIHLALKNAHKHCAHLDFEITSYRIAIRSRIPVEDAMWINSQRMKMRLNHAS